MVVNAAFTRYALQLLYDSLQDMNERVDFDLGHLQRPG